MTNSPSQICSTSENLSVPFSAKLTQCKAKYPTNLPNFRKCVRIAFLQKLKAVTCGIVSLLEDGNSDKQGLVAELRNLFRYQKGGREWLGKYILSIEKKVYSLVNSINPSSVTDIQQSTNMKQTAIKILISLERHVAALEQHFTRRERKFAQSHKCRRYLAFKHGQATHRCRQFPVDQERSVCLEIAALKAMQNKGCLLLKLNQTRHLGAVNKVVAVLEAFFGMQPPRSTVRAVAGTLRIAKSLRNQILDHNNTSKNKFEISKRLGALLFVLEKQIHTLQLRLRNLDRKGGSHNRQKRGKTQKRR